MVTGSGLLATLPLVVQLVLPHFSLSTPLIMLVPVLPTTPNLLRVEEIANSMVSSTSTRKPSRLTESLDCTVDLFPRSLALLFTAVFTLVYTIHSVREITLHSERS
jgi:hypothetical protein